MAGSPADAGASSNGAPNALASALACPMRCWTSRNERQNDVDTATAAADRFFRCYSRHCVEPDADTLFAYLDALHSFNDRLWRAGKGDLFSSAEFMALKSLRNLFHHETELVHEVRFVPAGKLPPISAEIMTVCLVSRELMKRALKREKEKDRDRIAGAFRWYGDVADIQPCVFNGAVDVYEACLSSGLKPSSEEHALFAQSYDFETENRHSHRVDGRIHCRAGDVEEVLAKLFARRPC